MATYFSEAKSSDWFYDGTKKTSASMTPGTMVKLDPSTDTWKICTSASGDKPHGIAMQNNWLAYKPANKDIADGTYVTILTDGAGRIYVSEDVINSAPAIGALLYSDDNGEFTDTDGGGQIPVGIYRGTETVEYGDPGHPTTIRHIIDAKFPAYTR